IIAMTAHSMNGYKEKCLETGMDDYLTKPLSRKDLLAMVAKWTTQSLESLYDSEKTPEQSRITTDIAGDEVPLNYEKVLEEFMGKKTVLLTVLEDFKKNVGSQIKTLRQAVSDGDADVVRKEAHSIKGGAANLTATLLSKTASDLENLGTSGLIQEGPMLLDRLENEFYRLDDYLSRFISQSSKQAPLEVSERYDEDTCCR
ncbi:MAG: response regulator, partial [Proteobacteria bacterium]|nr:response regulator [Pseudomonadota bacterium]